MGRPDDPGGQRVASSGSMRVVTARRSSPVTGGLLAAVLAGLLASGCSGSSGGSAAPTAPAASSTERPTVRPSGSLPPEAVAKQGAKSYAVFLAVAPDANDSGLIKAQDRAKQLGYEGGVGDIDCTPGARAALHLSSTGNYTAFSILFETAEQAQAFVSAYDGHVVGTAHVTAGCLD